MAKKTKAQELREELTWSFPHIAKDAPEQVERPLDIARVIRHSWTVVKQSVNV